MAFESNIYFNQTKLNLADFPSRRGWLVVWLVVTEG